MHKIIITFTFLVCLFTRVYAQKGISVAELEKIITETNLEAEKLKDSLVKHQSDGYFNPALAIEFGIDTFRIERIQERKMDLDYSTAGMLRASYEGLAEYDKLLNKYYKTLLAKLNSEDKEKLKKTQRNWIEYRDSEIELIGIMSDDEYSGGGTIQRLVVASRIQYFTKQRVITLFDYLVFTVN